MPFSKVILTVNHPVGLHAKPASMFVQTACKFESDVFVTFGQKTINAKNVISILSLGVRQGSTLEVFAVGADAEKALSALKLLVENNFLAGDD